MKKIGITGGIGAGKSLVCNIFEVLDIPNYPADARAKWLQVNNSQLKAQIEALFGAEAYQEGQLNRAFISKIVFGNPEKLKKLNELVHPAVAKDFQQWCENHQDKPFILKEAALLFETGSYKQLDATILVHAPEEIRLKRTLQRDPHRTEEEVQKIMDQQMEESKKLELADFIITNDGKTSLIKQCHSLFEKISRPIQ